MTVEPYANGGDRNARVYLGGTCWRAGDADHLGDQADRQNSQVDGSDGQVDVSGGSTDVLDQSNNTEMTGLSHRDNAGMYLSVGDTKCTVLETDGVGCHVDVSTGQMDASSIEMDAVIPTNAAEIISIPRRKHKPPDSPVDTARTAPDKPDGRRNLADTSSICTDMHSIETNRKTAGIDNRNVRIHQINLTPRNSPETHKIATAKPIGQWRKVSVREVEVYIPVNASIETASRTFAFGWLKSEDEAM